MQMPDIASRRFGMAFTSLRFDSELEWCQARAVPVGKTDVKYYSTVFSAKQACRGALTSIEKRFLDIQQARNAHPCMDEGKTPL